MNLAKGKPVGSKAKLTVDLNITTFRHFIYSKGWRFTWEQAELCPCRESTDSDAGRRGCPVCGGGGFLWHTPTEVRALVTSVGQDEATFDKIGPWSRGRAVLTLYPEHLPGRFDRFTALDSVTLFREIAERPASGVTSALRLPIARRVLELDAGTVTVGVLRARAITATGVAAASPLVEGVDFDVTEGGLIDWTKGISLGTAPAAGARYSATYTAHPIFVIEDEAYAVRDTRIDMKRGAPQHAPAFVKANAKLMMGP